MPLGRSFESDSSVFGVGVGLVSVLVDGDVVVVPADDDEVLLVGVPVLGPGGEMVGFETVSAGAAVDGAAVVVFVE